MASLNVSRASNTLMRASFLKAVALIIVGSLVGTVFTDWARNNIVDVGMAGGDVVYSFAGAAVTLALMGGSTGRYLALGMVASGGQVALEEFNVV